MKTVDYKTPMGVISWANVSGPGRPSKKGVMQYGVFLALTKEQLEQVSADVKTMWETTAPKSLPLPNIASAERVVDGKNKDPMIKRKFNYKETGNFGIQAHTNVEFPNGDTKTIIIYNTDGNPIVLPTDTLIGNGSIGAVLCSVGVWRYDDTWGVSFYLNGIQLDEYKAPSLDASTEALEGGKGSFQGFSQTAPPIPVEDECPDVVDYMEKEDEDESEDEGEEPEVKAEGIM